MDVHQMQRQLAELKHALRREELLDDQFEQLLELQDESNPNFVNEVVSLFFTDSQKIIKDLAATLGRPVVDFRNIAENVHQLKGSSASIGARGVKNVCVGFRGVCEAQNVEGCKMALQELQRQFSLVKQKLTQMFELEQKIVAAGGSLP